MQTRLAERLLRLAALEGEALAGELRLMHIEPTAQAQARARGLYEALLHVHGRELHALLCTGLAQMAYYAAGVRR